MVSLDVVCFCVVPGVNCYTSFDPYFTLREKVYISVGLRATPLGRSRCAVHRRQHAATTLYFDPFLVLYWGVAQGPCQGNCAEQNRISSPDDVQATAVDASRMRMVWQLLTCWTGTVDVLVSSMAVDLTRFYQQLLWQSTHSNIP